MRGVEDAAGENDFFAGSDGAFGACVGRVVAGVGRVEGLSFEVLDSDGTGLLVSGSVEEDFGYEAVCFEGQGVARRSTGFFGSQSVKDDGAGTETTPGLVGVERKAEKTLGCVSRWRGVVEIASHIGECVVGVAADGCGHRPEDGENAGTARVDLAIISVDVEIAIESMAQGSGWEIMVPLNTREDLANVVTAVELSVLDKAAYLVRGSPTSSCGHPFSSKFHPRCSCWATL